MASTSRQLRAGHRRPATELIHWADRYCSGPPHDVALAVTIATATPTAGVLAAGLLLLAVHRVVRTYGQDLWHLALAGQ